MYTHTAVCTHRVVEVDLLYMCTQPRRVCTAVRTGAVDLLYSSTKFSRNRPASFAGMSRMSRMHVTGHIRGPGRSICVLARGRGGWVVWGTINPSPSTDRQYIDFNRVFLYKPVLMQPVLGA